MNLTATGVMDVIEQKLNQEFAPEHLEIVDESESHRGHGGWREGGGTHFRVIMKTPKFDGISRVQRSRAVHAALKDELQSRIHALALELSGTG